MKLSILQSDLIGPLQLISGAVERRQTLPVLSNILLQVEDGILSLTGTDLEVEMLARVTLSNECENGEITVPAKKFLEICKSLDSNSLISLVLKENKLKLSTSKSRFTLSTLPASDFPNLEGSDNLESLQVNVAEIKELIDSTQFAMALQDVRYYLNGMLFEFSEEGKLYSVATDGHRMALSYQSVNTQLEGKIQAIVPRKGVIELNRFLSTVEGNVQLQISNNHIRASSESFTFTSKLVDGKHPDYQKVLPKGGDKIVVAHRGVLKEGLHKAAILCNEKFRGVRMLLSPNLLKLNSNNPEQEEAEVEIEVDYGGPELEIGFNVNYMLDVLNTVKTDMVRLTFSDENSSLLMDEVDGTNSLYVIMPTRL